MASRAKTDHYEEKFEYPVLKLIRQRAEKKNISYSRAANEVAQEFAKTIRFRDDDFENAALKKRMQRMGEVMEKWRNILGNAVNKELVITLYNVNKQDRPQGEPGHGKPSAEGKGGR